MSLAREIKKANRYRDGLNPMRGLTMARAVRLVEDYARGDFADLMWTYAAPNMGIESADADLLALIERRCGALVELDWNVKTADAELPGFDEKLAEEQAAALAQLYYGVDNLSAAIEHFSLASFRGFAHAEKVFAADGRMVELRLIDPWNVVRDGSAGAWKWNPEARSTNFAALPDEYLLPPEAVLCREVRRPINRVALAKAVRQNLSQKDWDVFIESYGLPAFTIIAPATVAAQDMPKFEEAARDLHSGTDNALPNGSQVVSHDGPRGVNPFRDHLKYLQEQLILAGTGGLLTMLTQSGSGTLAGGAHADTFAIIARAEARKISELFQRGLDREFLAQHFPSRPALAYFELAANDAVEPGEILKHAGLAAAAGYQMDANELSEKTGYALTVKPSAPAPSATVLERVANRGRKSEIGNGKSEMELRLEALLAADDDEFADLLQSLQQDLPELLKTADADTVAQWEAALGSDLVKSLKGDTKNRVDAGNGEASGQFDGNDDDAGGEKKTSAAPPRISAAAADAALTKGFTEKTADGREVKFGARMKDKLDKAADGEKRKEFLDWGREAVRSGKETEVTEKGEARTVFTKIFEEAGKDKGVLVVVDTADGEAFNLYRADAGSLRKKYGMKNGRQTGGLPPEPVLRAIAAAGGAPDWLQNALTAQKVNRKNGGKK